MSDAVAGAPLHHCRSWLWSPTTAIFYSRFSFPTNFGDKVELFKTAKLGDPEFLKKLADRRQDVDSEVLGVWDLQKQFVQEE